MKILYSQSGLIKPGYINLKFFGLLVYCMIFLLLFPSFLIAQESWPLTSEWVPLISNDWALIEDAGGDGPGSIDFVTDANGAAAYYYSTPTSLYFRMCLSESPQQNANKLRPFAWMAALDADPVRNINGKIE